MSRSTRLYRVVLVSLAVLLAFLAVGCGGERSRPARADGGSELTLGLLPIVDSLPFLVADERGYYQDEGLRVRLESFNSALERDAAFQAGAIDGGVADIIASAAQRHAGVDVKILSISLGVTPAEGRFVILASPDSTIRSVQDLKGVEIAISPNSIIEYVVDQLLVAEGFTPGEIRKTTVASIPVRVEMLLSGQVKAAALPEPMATLARVKGAREIIDDTRDNISQSVILFRGAAVREKEEAVRKLFRAYARAVKDIQADPESFRPLLEEKARLPKGLEQYRVDSFSLPVAPSREQVERVAGWMAEKGLLQRSVPYEDLVDHRFASPPR